MDERRDILQQVEAVQVAENLSNAQVAGLLDCSQATWSLIRKGTYRGNTDKFLQRAKAVLDERRDRKDLVGGGYVETSIGRNILAIARLAADTIDMALILAPSGVGKTAALLEFCRRRGEKALYVRATEYGKTKIAILRELARLLHVDIPASASIERAAEEVREKLAASYQGGVGLPRVLILDEAQTLDPSCLNLLRNLHDDPTCRLVVILSDTWRLHAEFGRMGGIAGGYEQLTSRFGAVYCLSISDPMPDSDVRALALATAEAMGHTQALPETSLKYLTTLAQDKGKLRNVVKVIQKCYHLADCAGRRATFSVHELDYAAGLMLQGSKLNQKAPPWARAKEDQPATATETPAA